MCRARGQSVEVLAFDSKRYVGAVIGIFSPSGDKVGTVSHTQNTEYVILCGEPDRVEAMTRAVSDDAHLTR
jgi:adenine-specific DNA-methyltransferase